MAHMDLLGLCRTDGSMGVEMEKIQSRIFERVLYLCLFLLFAYIYIRISYFSISLYLSFFLSFCLSVFLSTDMSTVFCGDSFQASGCMICPRAPGD